MADETFGIAVQLDPGDTIAKARQVEEQLAKTERAAEEMRQATARAAAEMRDRMAPAAKAFASVAEGIQRALENEREALERINAPAKQYAEHLGTLDRLLQKDKISTEQYAAEVTKLNRALAETPKLQAQRPADPSRGMQLMGFQNGPANRELGAMETRSGLSSAAESLGLGGAAASLATPAAAVGAIVAVGDQWEQYNKEIKEAEDRVTELTNKAQKFTGVGRDANDVIQQQTALGRTLNSTAAQTINVYDGIGDATAQLNLTGAEQARVTETVAKAAQLGGASMEAAAGIMNNLSVAFETGSGQGRTLQTLFKQFPDLADQLTSSLGLTKGQIVDMAEHGKLSFADLTRGLTTNTESIDEAYGRIKRTHSQAAAQFEEAFVRATAAGDDMFTSLRKAEAEMQSSGARTVTTLEAVNDVVIKLGRISDEAKGKVVDALGSAGRAADKVYDNVAKLVGVLSSDGFNAIARLGDPWFADHDKTKEIEAAAEKAKKLREEYEKLGKAILGGGNGAVTHLTLAEQYAQYNKDIEEAVKAETDAENQAVKAAEEATDEKIKAHEKWVEDVNKAEMEAAHKRDELAKKEIEAAKKVEEAWAQGLGSIAAEFVNMAEEGEINVDRLAGSFAKLALQIAAMQIGGPWGAFLGSFAGGLNLGGGANGFDYMADHKRLQLPGFATGGDMLVGGSGGTDSQLAMFRVTPGESIHVRTPQQRADAMAGGGSQVIEVRPVIENDGKTMERAGKTFRGKRAIVETSREIEQARRRMPRNR